MTFLKSEPDNQFTIVESPSLNRNTSLVHPSCVEKYRVPINELEIEIIIVTA